MNNVIKSIQAAVLMTVLFFLQFAVVPSAFDFFVFPAAAFYVATFLPASAALFLGALAGAVFDSMSLLPFGIYAIAIGGGMGGVGVFMRTVDERKVGARGVAASLLFSLYAVFLSMVYVAAGYSWQAVILHFYDIAAGGAFLGAVLLSHMLMQKTRKRS